MKIDCGDNSCHFAEDKSGMRTNGGCRCLSNAGFSRSAIASAYEMLPEILRLREERDALRAERDDARENSNRFQMQVMQLRAAGDAMYKVCVGDSSESFLKVAREWKKAVGKQG
jgi:hypothetical protein